MAENKKNQENNQEPEQIKEEEVTLAMVKTPWYKTLIKGVTYIATAAVGVIVGLIFGKKGNDDDDSGDGNESNE